MPHPESVFCAGSMWTKKSASESRKLILSPESQTNMQFTAKMIGRSTGLLGLCLGIEFLGPVVQSIVSLKMSLRCQLVKCMLMRRRFTIKSAFLIS